MRLALVAAAKDVRRQLRDPLTIAVWCGVPLLIGGLMSLAVGGGGGGTPRLALLVADEDESFLSEAVAGALSRANGMFVVESVARGEGERRMDAGDATALLVVPAGFGDAVLRSEPTTLELVTNPSQSVGPRIAEGVLEVLVRGAFYVQHLFGDVLAAIAAGPPAGARTFPNLAVASMSVEINELIERIVAVLDPPLVEVVTAVESTEQGDVDLAAVLFPGLLFMALLFVAQGASEDLWKERELGTLRRAVSTPGGLGALLLGKLLAGAVFAGGVALVGLLAGALLFGLRLGALPAALLWAVASGIALHALFLLLQTLGSTRRGASILTNLVVFPLMFLGGSFFAFEMMPAWMEDVGRLTPNGWALLRFRALLDGELDLPSLAGGLAALAAGAALLFALTLRRVRGGFAAGTR